jgi:hypothetical protein
VVKIARLASSLGLALFLGLAFVPPACGGSQPVDPPVPHGSEGPTIPDATIAELRVCASRGKDRREEATYAFHFDVEVMEDGHVDRVKHKESLPVDRATESCMAGALEGMRVPAYVVQALTEQAERAEGVSPQSRGLIGNPLLAAGAAVELFPLLLVVAGATVVVGVAVYYVEIDAARRRRRSKAQCYAACDAQTEVCEENCRIHTKEGTRERWLCWSACNEGNGQCKKKC